MYLVIDPETSGYVFTLDDPGTGGFVGEVNENVTLTHPLDVNVWEDGQDAPVPCLGVSPNDATVYEVFRSRQACEASGYRYLGIDFMEVPTWADYRRLRQRHDQSGAAT